MPNVAPGMKDATYSGQQQPNEYLPYSIDPEGAKLADKACQLLSVVAAHYSLRPAPQVTVGAFNASNQRAHLTILISTSSSRVSEDIPSKAVQSPTLLVARVLLCTRVPRLACSTTASSSLRLQHPKSTGDAELSILLKYTCLAGTQCSFRKETFGPTMPVFLPWTSTTMETSRNKGKVE